MLAYLYGHELDVKFFENQSYVNLSKNHVFHDMSKHIEIRYHYIIGIVHKGAMKLQYISIDEQIVDTLTKPLSRANVAYFRERLGVVVIPFLRKEDL